MLDKKALEGIAAYKYKAGSYTFLDNQLNHFWAAAVELLPMWMAPNLVTMIGTGAIMFTTAVQVFFAPHLSEASPAWVYLLSAFGLFFYQTMDALDGKQARRTGASSPLGQLFDHGCDALSTILTVINTAAVCQVGPGWLVYVALSSVSITFYLAQWEEYHTGVMSCGNGLYGVTEGQLTVVAAQLLTAVLGPAIWTTQIPGLAGVTLTHVLLVALVGSNIVLAYSNITNVLTAKPDAIPKSELGNKHVSKPLAVSQLIPIAILLALGSLWIGGPDAEDYAAYPVVFLFAIGIGYVLFSTRMIVSHMCKIPFSPQLRVIIPFGMVIFNAYAPRLGLLAAPLMRPMLASVLYVLFINCVYLHYVVHVVRDICDYLNIYLFRIVKKDTKAAE